MLNLAMIVDTKDVITFSANVFSDICKESTGKTSPFAINYRKQYWTKTRHMQFQTAPIKGNYRKYFQLKSNKN